MRADDAQGTPTQSHISPSIIVYEDQCRRIRASQWMFRVGGWGLAGYDLRVGGGGCRVQVGMWRVGGGGCKVQEFGIRDSGLGI